MAKRFTQAAGQLFLLLLTVEILRDIMLWHHPNCPTSFDKSLEWSPDSV